LSKSGLGIIACPNGFHGASRCSSRVGHGETGVGKSGEDLPEPMVEMDDTG
jgi:hypothetical protein